MNFTEFKIVGPIPASNIEFIGVSDLSNYVTRGANFTINALMNSYIKTSTYGLNDTLT